MSPTSYQTAPSRAINLYYLVPRTGIEPVRLLRSQDFKSCASANSATPAFLALRVGFEPTAYRLTAGCSTVELPKNALNWRLPTLPGRYHPSTIGVKRLNFCVRYGYRCLPLAIVTRLKTTLELLVYFKHEFHGSLH